jgi:hypothetical protein
VRLVSCHCTGLSQQRACSDFPADCAGPRPVRQMDQNMVVALHDVMPDLALTREEIADLVA